MDFSPTTEQEMLRETSRKFLQAECDTECIRELEGSEAGFSPELWAKLSELSWPGIIIPEEYGGVGLGLMDLAIVIEEMGYAAFDSP